MRCEPGHGVNPVASGKQLVEKPNSMTQAPREEPEEGFEPTAPSLQMRCSNQLSYSGEPLAS